MSATRRLAILLFFILLLTYAYFYQGGFPNQNSRYDLTLSIVTQGTYRIDSFHENTVDKAKMGDHYYTEKAPGVSLLALPSALLGYRLLGAPARLQDHPESGDFLLHFSTVSVVGVLSALAAVAFFWLLAWLNPLMPPRSRFALAALLYGGSMILPYSTMLFSHQVAGALLVLGLAAGVSSSRSPGLRRSLTRGLVSGACLGLAVVCEYPVAILAAGIGVVLLWLHPRKGVALASACAAWVPLLLIPIHNALSFGSPFIFGYQRLQETGFSEMSKGFFGATLPSVGNLLQLLFGYYRGFFVYCPILLLGLVSYARAPRTLRRGFVLPVLLSSLALVVFIASYGYWQGGVCYGPRHLVPIIPLLGLGFAFTPTWALRHPLSVAASIFMILASGVATATTPYLAEGILNPFAAYWGDFIARKGEFAISNPISINPMGFLAPYTEQYAGIAWSKVTESPYREASYNWGERILGLEGWSSLMPIALAWIAAVALGIYWSRPKALPGPESFRESAR